MPEYPKTLIEALCAVQANMPKVKKAETAKVTTTTGSYTYKYADLADVSEVLLPLLAANGLAWITQPVTNKDGTATELLYSLRHVNGESIDGMWTLLDLSTDPRKPPTAQQIGSAITYWRRYALCCVTGLAPDRDDDAAAASARRESWDDAKPQATVREPNVAKSRSRAEGATERPQRATRASAAKTEPRPRLTPETARAALMAAKHQGELVDLKARMIADGLEQATATDPDGNNPRSLVDIFRVQWNGLPPAPWKPTTQQTGALHGFMSTSGVDVNKRDEKLAAINALLPADQRVASTKELTPETFEKVYTHFRDAAADMDNPPAGK